MNALDIINKTKRKQILNYEEISWLVNNFTNGNIPDYQMSAWLMAVCLNDLTEEETLALTYAMRDTGETLRLEFANSVDKHSTGGVGDKTTLIIGPIAAACGMKVAKMSGRGLGHTGGTIDKLESIPGFRTDLSIEEFKSIVNENGFSVIAQNADLCPADKVMYALRSATATVDNIPLICASIMSKKLAIDADCLLLDVKYGSGAFMKTRRDAERLGELMEKIGIAAGKKCKAVISDMNEPLGRNIGNSLEVMEAIEVLRGDSRGELCETCIELAAEMLSFGGNGDMEECRKMASEAITSGRALEVFRRTIELQGGDPRVCDDLKLLPQPRCSYVIRAMDDIEILAINCEELGMVSMLLGAGRLTRDDEIDYSAGIVMNCKAGDKVTAGSTLMTLYSSICSDFSEAALRALNAVDYRRAGRRASGDR